MASETDSSVPETGALFTYGLTLPDEYVPSKFWLKNDIIVDFACGDEHLIFITRNGKAYSCGKNEWGQLGLGHKLKVIKPTQIKFFKGCSEKVLLLACGRYHSLFYTDKLRLYACGCNSEQQILPDGEMFPIPVLIDSWKSTPIKQLSCGVDMSALLTKSGEIYVWGSNDVGQLGLGKKESADVPTKLDIRSQWNCTPVQINCGPYHCGVVLQDGRLLMWGEAEFGKLGIPDDNKNVYVPKEVNLNDVAEVHCGLYHTLALTKRGSVFTWGNGKSGQLGLGNRCMQTNQPTQIQDLADITITRAAVGDEHSLIISDAGFLYSFGDGQYGKLGATEEEGFINRIRPAYVDHFSNFTVNMVACGHHQTLIYAEPMKAQDLKKRLSLSNNSTLTTSGSLTTRRRNRKRNRMAKSYENFNLPNLIDLRRSMTPSSGFGVLLNGDNKLMKTTPILRKPSDLASPRERNKNDEPDS